MSDLSAQSSSGDDPEKLLGQKVSSSSFFFFSLHLVLAKLLFLKLLCSYLVVA